ncbi:MAG: HAMP domain-containing protein, partial [Planctomycetaceae bacterium]|nr:HAMP domain-containing protein [Planctomycetaceae bacterium]
MRDPEAAPGRGRWSLALRLTILHGISSFLLVLAASLVLFAGLKAGLEQEDDRLLEDMAGVVAQFLDDTPPDFAAIRTEIEREVLARPNERLYARVMDGDLRTVIETPGLSELLDPGVFPVPAGEGCSFVNVRARDGTPYRLGSSFAASGDGVRRILHIAHDLTDDERLIAAYRRGLQALLIPALLVCMAVGYLVARRGLRPLAAISEAAGRVGPEHLDRRIRSAGLPAEISDLARTLD